jgi:hypothetical protein
VLGARKEPKRKETGASRVPRTRKFYKGKIYVRRSKVLGARKEFWGKET